MDMKLPFSTTGMMLHLDDSMDYEVLSSSIESMPKSDKTEDEIVLEAMAHPIGSPKLSELSKGKENVVIICSDHTRPVPSKHIIPFMLKEIREGNPDAKITLLIATGFHRATTREELVGKFGEEIVDHEHIVIHDSQDMDAMENIGTLPSGAPLLINKVAANADLLVSEGFIETHFFAGFSGGIGALLGNSGGYIIGFIFSALVMWAFEKFLGRKPVVQIISMIVGLLVCYAFGTVWFMVAYARSTGAVGLMAVLGWCVFPFIIPDLIKIALAYVLSGKVRKYAR